MRPLRLLLSITTCIVATLLLLYTRPSRASSEQELAARQRDTIGAYFNWHAPSSLFPPSAIISLTDDNSTFFLARPANFGPALPVKSLSAPLWVGSGFGEEHIGHSSSARSEGELGCTDIPDWEGGSSLTSDDLPQHEEEYADSAPAKRRRKRSISVDEAEDVDRPSDDVDDDDGTDDHLNPPNVLAAGISGSNSLGSGKAPHADIQSIQEAAEIEGKVVLLSRGGCGFLDKVKWAQRRGAVAVIVGDDVRGAGLVTMYARGDTSNVSIPAIFTSHTTAHLLASLMSSAPSRSGLLNGQADRVGIVTSEKPQGGNKRVEMKPKADEDRPNFTTSTAASNAKPTAKAVVHHKKKESSGPRVETKQSTGWLRSSLFGSTASRGRTEDSRRPPSSGNVGWFSQTGFEQGGKVAGKAEKSSKHGSKSPSADEASTKPNNNEAGDNFRIGVQDWRDPDLVAEQKERLAGTAVSSLAGMSSSTQLPSSSSAAKLLGGSITPGSGEYVDDRSGVYGQPDPSESEKTKHTSQTPDMPSDSDRSWISKLFRSSDSGREHGRPHSQNVPRPKTSSAKIQAAHPTAMEAERSQHDELWVTLTPTPMSSSPFFDTLLVLVVSPLVTLTIVYALLILRSRIRRRRWRAPKSVVERLPVRTYQTMPSTTSSTVSSPVASSRASDTTPLLPTSARPIHTRTSVSPAGSQSHRRPSSSPVSSVEMASPSLDQVEEKRAAGLAEWRRRYGGKQRECVVCLEEYVDGVSRVMSLPCGHEFHAECITPWLTTRRRTCPICKGDVVRSLARASTSASGSFFGQSLPRYRDNVAERDAPPSEPAHEVVAEQHRNGASSDLESGASHEDM